MFCLHGPMEATGDHQTLGTGCKNGREPPRGCWEPALLQEPGLQCSEPQPSLCTQRQLGTQKQLAGGRLLPPPCPSSFQEGEMVLLDGGCESSCYVSDITRTWPINGRFTAPQAELYEAVLEIQKACLTLCSPGTSLENIYSMMLTLMGQKLKDLGIIKTSKESAFKVPPSLFTPVLQNSQQPAAQLLPCLGKLIIGLGHCLAVLCKMHLALT